MNRGPHPEGAPIHRDLRSGELIGALGVEYLLVGMSAALMQGARGATEDIDLWFQNPSDSRIGEAARAAGGFYVSGAFGMQPPQIGGRGLEDRFDVVLTADGLDDFTTEASAAVTATIDGVAVKLLPLERIVHSKRTAGRTKDQLQLPALLEAVAVAQRRQKDP